MSLDNTAGPGPASRWVAERLEEFGDSYAARVRPSVDEGYWLGAPGPVGRVLRYLTEPVVWTLDQRESFFRSGFTLAGAKSTGAEQAGGLLGATVELGWSCALVVDDVIDGGLLRDGHPCAHVKFGRARALVGTATVMVLMLPVLGARVPLEWRRRVELIRWGWIVTGQALSSAIPRRRWTLRRYAEIGGFSNSAALWAIVAPVAGAVPSGVLDELRQCAVLMCDNGKLRNDLLDYVGSSSDNGDQLADFSSRRVTYPVLVCLEQTMDPRDRAALEAHFKLRPGPALELDDGMSLLRRYRTFERCAEILLANGVEGARRIRALAGQWPEGEPLVDLLHDWALLWPQAGVEQLASGPDQDAE